MSARATKPKTASLELLASQIVDANRACEEAVESSLKHAIRCGGLLLAAKKKLGRGAWKSWLTKHTGISYRQCAKYMQVAQAHGKGKVPREALSGSLNAALKAVQQPRPAPERAVQPGTDDVPPALPAAVKALRRWVSLYGAMSEVEGLVNTRQLAALEQQLGT